MATEKPQVNAENAHFLKGYASWLYCDECNKTVAYLCYVTYDYFRFAFQCSCGCSGWVENQFNEIDISNLAEGQLQQSVTNKRYCCPKDDGALFSPVPKNLKSYNATVVCKKCGTKYSISEAY